MSKNRPASDKDDYKLPSLEEQQAAVAKIKQLIAEGMSESEAVQLVLSGESDKKH